MKQEVQGAIQALKEYSVEQRDEVVKETKAVLDKLDSRIDALEERLHNNWDKMHEATRKKACATLKLLRKQRTQFAEWYGGLKHISVDAWEDVKRGISDSYISFCDAWEKAESEFGSTETGKGSN